MAMIDGLLQELEQEAQTTRRVLARVPQAHLEWKPAEKSMTLGQLALHIASLPGMVAEMASKPSIQRPAFIQPGAKTASELVPTLEHNVRKAREILGRMDDGAMTETWRVFEGDREVMALPRAAVLRAIMLNHWYHHRGQLSVYLRLLGVPVPSIYGPSADESPFEAPRETIKV
jgi:uncharacterized damage-inducible protein DinB